MNESIFLGNENILRYPRLDTVLMVEQYIKTHDGEFKKRKLWESLPKKMMYQTFCVIIDYLLYSRKISVDAESKIGWIYYPEQARTFHARKELGRNEATIRDKVRR
jgi:phage pi2 protein 07